MGKSHLTHKGMDERPGKVISPLVAFCDSAVGAPGFSVKGQWLPLVATVFNDHNCRDATAK